MKIKQQIIPSISPCSLAQSNLKAAQLFLVIISFSFLVWVVVFVTTLFFLSQEVSQDKNQFILETKNIIK
ncbi:hypothetical protein NIES4101_66380 [Calothrix sp. NIES-4101]|nr:hypothetical protein NIES4101_66380 [Calothrix sp. NIES-4101]